MPSELTSKTAIAEVFRTRLQQLIDAHPGGLARFAADTGVDRSALSQFLNPDSLRLPRAETLARIATAKGTSTDWLLGLANVTEGGQEVASSVEIETAEHEEGRSRLARWQSEAIGGKIRYVPSGLPDLLRLPEFSFEAVEPRRATARTASAAEMRQTAQLTDTDVEISMPIQPLEDLSEGRGIWVSVPLDVRRRQLTHMSELTERLYPTVRLHLYDGQQTFSAPLTVFGLKRAALYLGKSYIVVTSSEQVRELARHFDDLVREATHAPNMVHETLAELAKAAR